MDVETAIEDAVIRQTHVQYMMLDTPMDVLIAITPECYKRILEIIYAGEDGFRTYSDVIMEGLTHA